MRQAQQRGGDDGVTQHFEAVTFRSDRSIVGGRDMRPGEGSPRLAPMAATAGGVEESAPPSSPAAPLQCLWRALHTEPPVGNIRELLLAEGIFREVVRQGRWQ